MGDVTKIGPAEETVFVCRCGCSTWLLLDDAAVECAACGNRSVDYGAWYREKPEAKDFTGTPFTNVQGNGSVEFARRRITQMASDPDVRLALVVRTSGTLNLWSDVHGKKQIKWARRRLKEVAGLLKKGRH